MELTGAAATGGGRFTVTRTVASAVPRAPLGRQLIVGRNGWGHCLRARSGYVADAINGGAGRII